MKKIGSATAALTAFAIAPVYAIGVDSTANAPIAKHNITELPGWTDLGNALPSNMYTGFIDAGTPPSGVGTMYFHYWMMESEHDPDNDPVVIWYNGGPGASSLFGLLQELGPLLLNVNSYDSNFNKSGIPTLQRNKFAWTNVATVIAIDSPPPIGFSYCSEKGPSANGTSCGPWRDTSVFEANHKAHKSLFEDIFPNLKGNDLYFAGESYAGIYVPGFVKAMIEDGVSGMNLKGFLVGDGWTGCPPVKGKPVDYCVDLDNVGVFKYPNTNYGPFYDIEFFHGHSQFSEELYREIKANCPESMLRTPDLSDICLKLVEQVSEEVGYFFAYNLYNSCPIGELDASKYGINQALERRRDMHKSMLGDVGGSPCPGNSLTDWLSNAEVLRALNLPSDSNFLNLDNGHGFNYTSDEPQITPIYKEALDHGLRVLVYEGDSDACGLQTAPVEDIFVPYFKKIGLNKTQSWRPWTTDGAQNMGGYVIEWNDRKAQFISIRGAGHLVPANRPSVALSMLQHFLANEAMPQYVRPNSNDELSDEL
jgi:cathepsin A (carboxypeptidase C)